MSKLFKNVQKVHDFQNQKALKRPLEKLSLHVLFRAGDPKDPQRPVQKFDNLNEIHSKDVLRWNMDF